MALSPAEQALFDRLSTRLGRDQKTLKRFDTYYEGTRRLETLGMAVPPGLEAFTTMVAWPRITIDSPAQRLGIRGFRLDGASERDDELWNIWRANGMETESHLAHVDALTMGRGYVVVGSRSPDDPDPDVPLITIESPLEMIHETSTRTHRVTGALRKGKGDPSGSGTAATMATLGAAVVEHATLFTPGATTWLERSNSGNGWAVVDVDNHDFGEVLVKPLLNRARTHQRYGVSEIFDIITLTDAGCRALTNAQIATEALAVPQKYALGVEEKDFVDPETGEMKTQWESYYGAVWALLNSDAKVGQFTAADLGNFETIVNHYANLVSGTSGLPTRYYGQNTTNPPSEGSIVADEARLIQNVERMHTEFGGTWVWSARAARRIIDGAWDPALRTLETLWRNPATPTIAQEADAAVKKFQARDARGRSLLPLEMARESIGFTPADLRRARELDQDDLETDDVARAVRGLTDVSGGGAVNPAEATGGSGDVTTGIDPTLTEPTAD